MQDAVAVDTGIVRQIKEILVEDLHLRIEPEQIPDDYSLLEGGLALDSVVIAELIVQLEIRFGFHFDDAQLAASLFEDLSRLAAFVEAEIARARGDAEGLPETAAPKGAARC